MISVEVFDDRRCWLGEGPTATGENNNHVQWVDILNGKVLSKNLETSKTSEYKWMSTLVLQFLEPAGEMF